MSAPLQPQQESNQSAARHDGGRDWRVPPPRPAQPPLSLSPTRDETADDNPYEVLPPVDLPPVEPPWQAPPDVQSPRDCPACGYDMRGIPSAKCPECGADYHDAVARIARREDSGWSWLWSLRWALLGLVSMPLLWVPVAWGLLKFGGFAGYLLAVVSGVLVAAGVTFFCAAQAYEEQSDEIEGIVLAGAIIIGVGGANVGCLGTLFSLL